VSTGQTSQLS